MHIVLVLALVLGIFLMRLLASGKEIRKIETVYAGLLIFFYGALRGETVGIDLSRYASNYLEISHWSINDILYHSSGFTWSRDPLFWVFMKMMSAISSDPQIMIVTVSATVAVSISTLIYRSKSDVLICFLVFICLRYYSFTLTGLRQAMAMSVLYFAMRYLETKKIIPFVLVTLLASAFHGSAIVFLLAYPVLFIKKTNFLLVLSLAFVVLSFVFSGFFSTLVSFIPFLDDRFTEDVIQISSTGTGSMIFSIYLFILFIVFYKQEQIRVFILKRNIRSLLKYKKKQQINANITLYFNFLIIGTMLSLVAMAVTSLFRIAYFFIVPSLIYLFPKTIDYYQRFFKNVPLKLIVMVLLILQFIIIGPGGGTDNYLFYWE